MFTYEYFLSRLKYQHNYGNHNEKALQHYTSIKQNNSLEAKIKI